MLISYFDTSKFENNLDCILNLNGNVTTQIIDQKSYNFNTFDLFYGIVFSKGPNKRNNYRISINTNIGPPIIIPLIVHRINKIWYGFVFKDYKPLVQIGKGFKDIKLIIDSNKTFTPFKYIIGYVPTSQKEKLISHDYDFEYYGLSVLNNLGIR